jgi:hypothetical protein
MRIRDVITAEKKPIPFLLWLKASRAVIQVYQGLGPFGGYGNINVVIPFPAKLRRHILTFRWKGGVLQAIAFGMCLHHVEKMGSNLKIRFSMEDVPNPGFVDQVIGLIDKVASALC